MVVFVGCLPLLRRTNTISIDFDWVYRRVLRYIHMFSIRFIDYVYNLINNVTMVLLQALPSFYRRQFQPLCI